MKVKIRLGKNMRKEEGTRFRGIALFFPNSLLKSRFIFNVIKKSIKSKMSANDGKPPKIDVDGIDYKLLKIAYKALKTVIKTNGHFDLVDVSASDGTKVIIRL